MINNRKTAFLAAALLFMATPEAAFAYIGPGAGISAIGTVVALIGGVFLLIAGFVWYPIKRMLGKGKLAKQNSTNSANSDNS